MAAERELLERATVALERQERAFERQETVLESMVQEMQNQSARLAAHDKKMRRDHERMLERFARSEDRVTKVLGDIDLSMQESIESIRRNTERLDDMGDAIRANTRAVLSVLDH